MIAELQQSHFTAARVAARTALRAAEHECRMAARAATSAWMSGRDEPQTGRLAAAQAAVTAAQDALFEANRGLYSRVPRAPVVVA